MPRPKVTELLNAAKRAWEATEPVRDAKEQADKALKRFEHALTQYERPDREQGLDDDLNKLDAVTAVIAGDTRKIAMQVGAEGEPAAAPRPVLGISSARWKA